MEAFSLFGFAISYALIWKAVRIALYVIIGFPLLSILVNMFMRSIKNYGTPHVRMLINKVLYYSGFLFLIIAILNEFGFQLTALLGAAGIFGVAIGFASQTSMSNLISGLFLLSEGFLSAGDLIECGGVKGVVETIDLFSVKIRTFDDELIRVPNEKLIKNDLRNITYYPYRRAEVAVSIPVEHGLNGLVSILNDVVDKNEFAVTDPAHDIVFNSISSSALHVTLRVWSSNKNFFKLKQAILPETQTKLASKNIKPFYIIIK